MKILAFDTSNSGISLALLENETLIEEIALSESNKQSELLIPLLEQLLSNHKLCYQDLNLIASVNGPGSFTGVRVGLTCAKILQISTNLPLVILDALEVIASNYRDQTAPILVINDAKMDEFFIAEFLAQDKKLITLTPSRLVSKDELDELIAKKNYFLCGSAKNEKDQILAAALGKLAYEKFLNESVQKDSSANYLRAPRITERKK